MTTTLRRLAVLITLPGLLALVGCKRDPYPQITPDAVVDSAIRMVEQGDADQLANLIYADSPPMRAMLKKLGGLLGSLEDLSAAVEERFPEEVAALRAQAEDQAAAQGQNLLSRLGQRRPRDEREGREAFEATVRGIFADPFGAIERNRDRLSTMPVADDMAAVMLDNAPVPPIGLTMQKDGDKWYIVLPLNLPVVSQFMPRTHEEWSIIANLVDVFNNAVIELTADVRRGKVQGIDDLARLAGDKAFVPAAMVFLVYSREMDVRQRIDRMSRDFRSRKNKWSDEWASVPGRDGAAPPEELIKAIDAAADLRLREIARADGPRPRFAEMSRGEFEATLEEWLNTGGVRVSLAGDMTPAEIVAALASGENARRSAGRN